MKLVTIKPVNEQINNLAIINTATPYRNPLLVKMGGIWYGKEKHYYNRRYKDTEQEILYESKHHEIPFPLLPRIETQEFKALMSYLRGFKWSKEAADLYRSSVKQMEQIKGIRAGDTNIISDILKNAGLDPDNFVRRNADGTSAMQQHQLAALALYIICKYSDNWGQMRTGKTPPTLIYTYWLLATKQIDLAIYVVPNTIKHGWYNEIPKDMPKEMLLMTDIIEGSPKKKSELWFKNSFIKIVNYEGIRAESGKRAGTLDTIMEALKDKRYLLVIDEAHNIKNSDSLQSRGVTSLRPTFFVALSGTLVANKPEDVYVPISFTQPQLLGYSFSDFKETFCKLGGYSGNDVSGYKDGCLDEIGERIKTISVRALRSELGIGFGKQIQPVELQMSSIMKDLHEEIRHQFVVELQSSYGWTGIKITSFLARLVRLQQAVAGYLPKILPDGTQDGVIWMEDKDNVKIMWLDKFLKDYLDDLGKVVIFSRFIPVITKISKRYSFYGSTYVCGEIKAEDRIKRIDQFRDDPECRVLVVNVDIAAGLDMNPNELPPLAKTQVAIFYERTFYLMPNEQAEDRITGMNQKAPSTIIPLVCGYPDKNGKWIGIDANLEYKILPKKRKYANAVMGGGHDVKISKEELEVGLKMTQEDLFDLVGV